MAEATIEIPMPPSVNRLWRVVQGKGKAQGKGKSIVVCAPHYKQWMRLTVPLMRIGLPIFHGPVKVTITIRGGKGWLNRRDIGNTDKATLDALVHARRIPDDNCQHVVHEEIVYLLPVPGMPACCWLTVREVDIKDYTIDEAD